MELVLAAVTGEITWHLTLEDGGEQTGRTAFGALELIGARSFDGTPFERRRLLLDTSLPWGYHCLSIEPGDVSIIVVITPGRCWLPLRLPRGDGCGG